MRYPVLGNIWGYQLYCIWYVLQFVYYVSFNMVILCLYFLEKCKRDQKHKKNLSNYFDIFFQEKPYWSNQLWIENALIWNIIFYSIYYSYTLYLLQENSFLYGNKNINITKYVVLHSSFRPMNLICNDIWGLSTLDHVV